VNRKISIEINGRSFEGEVEPRLLLADFIRDNAALTGTHLGCEHGVCGACTVQLDGRPVRSCLLFAVQANGRRIATVEGMAPSTTELHPLQQAFIDEQAAHCGYCYNGMTIKASELLAQNPHPSEAEIRSHMDGHLCRCGTYPRVMKAIQVAAARITGESR